MLSHYEGDDTVFYTDYQGACVKLKGTYYYYEGIEDGLYKYSDN